MPSKLPEPALVHKAIEIYLANAYTTAPPLATRSLLNLLKTWAGDFYASPAFARTGASNSPRLTIRLGNSVYPHMKLALEPAPDGETYVFKADSHDRHLCPAESDPDYPAFMKLREENQQIVDKVEQAWGKAAVPTFKTYLHADLEKRRASAG